MAYIEKTAFEARITNNEFEALCNITGKYQVSAAAADCSAGVLCVRVSQLPCEGFPNVMNENAWVMNAATADTNANDVVYACDTYDAQKLSNGRNTYYVGHETLGLGVPANEYGNFKRIDFDGESVYRFGEGNFTAAIGENGFATIGANGLLTPAEEAPETAGALYFEVRGTGNFTEGTTNSFGYVDLCARKVAAAS